MYLILHMDVNWRSDGEGRDVGEKRGDRGKQGRDCSTLHMRARWRIHCPAPPINALSSFPSSVHRWVSDRLQNLLLCAPFRRDGRTFLSSSPSIFGSSSEFSWVLLSPCCIVVGSIKLEGGAGRPAARASWLRDLIVIRFQAGKSYTWYLTATGSECSETFACG